MNTMRTIRLDKLTLNFGAGKDQSKMDKGAQLIEMITGIKPIKTVTQARIPGWGLRPGLPIGLKLTLRGEKARDVLDRLLEGRERKLAPSCVDDNGNISFGVPEYIDIPGVRYDPKIGIIGLQASVTLSRPGYRVQRRKLRKARIGHAHRINREDAQDWIKENFKVEFTQ